MAMGKLLVDSRLVFGSAPVHMLDRCSLSPMARLLWIVLDACGKEHLFPSKALLAVRMGLVPNSKKSVTAYLSELTDQGFLRVQPRQRSGMSNNYFLTMPDYCFIEERALLKAALAAPVAPTRGGWTAGRGKTAKRRKRRVFDAVAWLEARRLRRLDTPLEDDLFDGLNKPEGGVSGPYPLGSASPTPEGQPAPPGGVSQPHPEGSASPTRRGQPAPPGRVQQPHQVGSASPSNNQGEVPRGRDGAPPPTASPRKHQAAAAPEGWASYPDKYRERHGKMFRWSSKSRGLARAITVEIGADQVPATIDNFLANEYWSKRHSPLEGLRAQLLDFTPRTDTPPVGVHVRKCQHINQSNHVKEATRNGKPGVLTWYVCDACGHETEKHFVQSPVDVDLEARG